MSWRARIGGLYPADGDLDQELWRFLPAGASLHLTRTWAPLGDYTIEEIIGMAELADLAESARLLCRIPLDCVAYLCTAASFIRGPGGDLEIVRRLEAATGLPATTTSTALVQAAEALGVGRLAVVAPYPAEITERLLGFLAGNGIEVVGSHAMGLSGAGMRGTSATDVYRLVRQVDCPKAEAIFISCTGLRTADVLEALEEDLGKPALSANQVTLWHALRLAGVRPHLAGLGKLYRLT